MVIDGILEDQISCCDSGSRVYRYLFDLRVSYSTFPMSAKIPAYTDIGKSTRGKLKQLSPAGICQYACDLRLKLTACMGCVSVDKVPYVTS